MIELIILWIYILLLSTAIGIGVLNVLGRGYRYSFAAFQMVGLIFISFYAQVWSIFGKVSALAHIMLVLFAVFCVIFNPNSKAKSKLLSIKDVKNTAFVNELLNIKRILFSWEGVLYIILILITAFYASRGAQHTDTYIYHAEMIRWYEEYGVVIGLGNLQNHFAYNSAYLAYAAIFSMKWLVGQSLHGTGGFIQALLVVWSVRGLLRIRTHIHHGVDACRIAIIIYAIVNSEYIMSPATDFGALYLVLWIMTLWVSLAWPENGDYCDPEQKAKENAPEASVHLILQDEKLHKFALLCVAICVATTYKLAAGMMVVAAIYPAIELIRKKKIRDIFIYLGLGILVLLPWVVRNVIISGCIVYPLNSLRLGFLDWAIPSAYLAEDNAGITAWAKCLFDRELVDTPIQTWLPVWWGAKDTYEKMLIISNVIALFGELLYLIKLVILKKKNKCSANVSMTCFKCMIFACLLIWFIQAPFIRYGLAFLLVFPLVEVAQWIPGIGTKKKEGTFGPFAIISGFALIGILLSMTMYLNYYTLNDVILAKTHILKPYYIVQKDYEKVEYRSMEMDNSVGDTVTVYYPDYDQDNSYAPIPSTACIQMGERTKLRGTVIKQGFVPKYR